MEENPSQSDDPLLVSGEGALLRRPGRIPLSLLERWFVRRFLKRVGAPPVRLRFWDGSTIDGGPQPKAELVIRDRAALWRIGLNPSLAFGEEYAEGGMELPGDLTETMRILLAHRPPQMDARFPAARRFRPRPNNLRGSRRNIRHHYDIGNPFYALWLDPQMVYTCAYFPEPSATLEAAQFAKMELVCRKLRLKPGQTVVEAGCGWGGLARHMARHHGVRVRAYNISREQVAWARERAAAEGLADRVDYVEEDWRHITGRFDAFVSVGMLEHVGTDNYRLLGATIDRCLKPLGRGLIHSIGQNRSEPLGGWVERHIFPGAYPPTLREMMEIVEPAGFTVVDVENLRPHYAKTLEQWLARFDENVERVREMFDDRFVRAWRLYLVSSMASFSVGHLQLFQMLFERAAADDYPWTRQHLYERQ